MEGARGILSCGSCRQRKLKCDRREPCGNCVARDVDCRYASYSRGRRPAERREATHQLDARIRHLEQLINTMASQKPHTQPDESSHNNKQPIESAAAADQSGWSGRTLQSNSHSPTPAGEPELEPGRIVSSKSQMTYISSTHWASVCNEVADIRKHLDEVKLADHVDSPDHSQSREPMLLEGLSSTVDIQEILSSLPPRSVADRLISRYFNNASVSVVLLHAPAFEQEYQRFWADHQDASVPWVGLLFGVMSMAVFLSMQSQEDLPETIGGHMEVMETFQRRSTECLILSKYSTAPGPYTIEALMLNLQNEFVRRRDAHPGVWVLAGVAIRLAMRMGYHRDPASYPQLSVFQGEMRRRVWVCMSQLDTLTSYQLGLPPMIQEQQCDTQLPSNLFDEDFGPDSVSLPPSRPDTELTPMLYTITKDPLSSMFREIYNRVALGRTETHEAILDMDKRLHVAREAMSPRFRMNSTSSSVVSGPYLLIRQYGLELFFQKARCILHRHHMTKSYQDPRYAFSRSACVDAAMTILSHQVKILREVQAGGLLHRNRWLITSIEQTDFLLASMIIALELSFRAREQANPVQEGNGQGSLKFSRQNLIEALGDTRLALSEMKESSSECQQAFDVLSILLQKFSENSQTQGSQASTDGTLHGSEECNNNGQTAAFRTGQPQPDQTEMLNQTFTASTIEGIESFFNDPHMTDWTFWETLVQGPKANEQDPFE